MTRGKAAEAGTPPALRQPSLVIGRQGTTPSITPSITPLPGASYIHEKEKASSIRVGQSGSGSHRHAEARGSPLTQAGSCREQGALSRLQACLQPASTGRDTSRT